MRSFYFVLTLVLVLVLFGGAQAAPVDYQNLVLADDPALYYQFNETIGPAINYGNLGNNYDATYWGTPTRGAVTSGGDTGVAFHNFPDYLTSSFLAPSTFSGNPSFTAEAIVFVPITGTASNHPPFLHWGSPSILASVYFGFVGGAADEEFKIYAGFFNGGVKSQNPVALGEWHHIVWVRQGGGAANVGTTLYIDGASVSLENTLGSHGGTPNVTTANVFSVNRSQSATRYFTGTLDELVLYDRELSEGEVLAHYAAFSAIPIPGTLLLLGSALIGLTGVRRKFRKS